MSHPYPVRFALTGAGLVLVSITVFTLWIQGHAALVHLLKPVGLMSVDAAAGLCLLGLGLMASGQGAGKWVWLAAILAGVLALMNLASLFGITGTSLTRLLDNLWGLPPGLSNPAMPNTVMGIFIGAIILPQFLPTAGTVRIMILGVGSVLLLSASVVPLVGYALSLEPAMYWPGFGEMAALSAVALTILGSLGLFVATHASLMRAARDALAWPSLALGVGAIACSALVAIALANAQTSYVARVVEDGADSVAREMEALVRTQVQGLLRVVHQVEQTPPEEIPALLDNAAELLLADGYQGLIWLAPDLSIRRIRPLGAPGLLLTQGLITRAAAQPAVREALAEGSYAVSAPLPLVEAPNHGADGGREPALTAVATAAAVNAPATDAVEQTRAGFYILMPAHRNGSLVGVLAAAHDVHETLDTLLTGFTERGLILEIMSNQTVLYRKGHAAGVNAGTLQARARGIGPDWTLVVTPTRGLVQRYRNMLPETVMLLGSVLGLLAAFSLHTRQMLGRSSRHIRELNTQLERKVKRRTAALLREVTERERYAAKLAHAAKHDSLTDLPNRQLFAEHLVHAVADARRGGSSLVVMFIDLDNFKEVNDRFGHAAGDELLRQVARRMRFTLRQADVVARQGGDEFLVLADTLAQPLDAGELASKLLLALNRGFELGEQTVHVAVSIGLASYPGDDYDGSDEQVAHALIRNADTAMYQAKTSGKNRYEFHSRELQERIQARLSIKDALGKALANDALEVYYQPRISLIDRRIIGAEALLRWNHPSRGWISPEEFIPIAEETGIIVELGTWVLERVYRDLLQWNRQGRVLPLISVNASIHQFRDQQILLDLRQRLKQWPGVEKHLELELTERVWIDERPEYQRLLREIHGLGVRIAIDDFGTGCSSLSYFSRFPIDVLKIDKSFIKRMVENRQDAMIARSIIDLGRNFELTVVAEGVETESQYRRLRDYGCHEAQGYLFAQALPAGDFMEIWQAGRAVQPQG